MSEGIASVRQLELAQLLGATMWHLCTRAARLQASCHGLYSALTIYCTGCPKVIVASARNCQCTEVMLHANVLQTSAASTHRPLGEDVSLQVLPSRVHQGLQAHADHKGSHTREGTVPVIAQAIAQVVCVHGCVEPCYG